MQYTEKRNSAWRGGEATMKTRVFDSPDGLAAELAGRLAEELGAEPGRAVMLAGGKTPLAAYAALAGLRRGLGPSQSWAVLSDERMVSKSSSENNNHNIALHFVAAGIPAMHILSVDTSHTLEQAAHEYDLALGRVLKSGMRLSLGILGLGADGHTASLFGPADVSAAERSGRLAIPVRRLPGPNRVSVTPVFLRHFETLIFVVELGFEVG